MRYFILFIGLFLLSCTEDTPTYYYEPVPFDILRLGSNITDMLITLDGNTLIASDEGNNRLIFINIDGAMAVNNVVIVGSKPGSLALSDDGNYVYSSLYGSSSIAMVDLSDYSVLTIPLGEDSPTDVEIMGNKLVTSFISDQSVFHRTKLYEVSTGDILSEKPKAGILTQNPSSNSVFVLDQSFERVNLYRYDVTGNLLTDGGQSSDIVSFPVELHDLQFIPNVGVAVAMGGVDFTGNPIKNVFIFEPDGLNLLAHLDCKSEPLAVASGSDGSSVFVSPSKEDGAGTFIIEFDTDTFLQRNYYLTAGKLAQGALVIDSENQYIYCAVDDQADNSKDEPYSGNSFDIQRIAIVPYGTYPVNDF